MLNDDPAYQNFLDALKSKFPERGKLASELISILPIEKEGVYRRLRGDVQFGFPEVIKIAQKFNISLDEIIGCNTSKSRPFQLRLIDYENPTPLDFEMQYNLLDIFGWAENDPLSEMGMASNLIPMHLCMSYDYIYRFHRMKWYYQFGSRPRKFKEVIIYDKIRGMVDELVLRAKKIAFTHIIWDNKIIPSLVEDIKYFYQISLIDKEELEQLKQELHVLINDLEKIAIRESYPDTGKKVHLYITGMSFETEFLYYKTNDITLSNLRAFTLNDVLSLDQQVFEKIKKWMHSLIRTSTMISGSNEMQRVAFFNEQRKVLELLD